jgi:trk system potassium uptake protein TrkH
MIGKLFYYAGQALFRLGALARRVLGTTRDWWTAPRLFVGSFVFLILLGTVALEELPGLYTGEPLGWLDALFTSTSAVCVTGLIVTDTATAFTGWGQALLLLLIQLGGLGIITFTTLIILGLGRRLSLHHEAASASTASVAPHVDFRSLSRNVVRFTLAFEGAGAVLLYLLWVPRFGWAGAGWPAVFHSVSAFCNAGFSTFSDSLMGFRSSAFTQLVIMVLIVVGGIGFLSMEELALWRRARRQKRRFRLSLHSRLALTMTVLLIALGAVVFTVFEWELTLRDLPAWQRVVNGLFMSVTARTAGFNTIDYGQAADASNFLTVLLMSVGGSPGSTAGGIKTTTFALIGLLAWSRWRGQGVTSLWGRTLPEETIHRAVGLFVLSVGLITLSIFVLSAVEIGLESHPATRGELLPHIFEATSAFNTVGLSMGVTSELSPAGRVLMILLMFLGRVGPLTFAAAIALRSPTASGEFRYAYEDVIIG